MYPIVALRSPYSLPVAGIVNPAYYAILMAASDCQCLSGESLKGLSNCISTFEDVFLNVFLRVFLQMLVSFEIVEF